MKSPFIKSLLFSTLSFLIFTQCQTGKVKSVQYGGIRIEPRFGQTIETKQNLVFRFSKTLVKPEQIGIWDTTQFFQIQPRVVGQFKWAAVDELIFSPDKGFSFATGYSAHPSKSLGRLAGEELNGEPIRFETEQLKVNSCESHWFKNEQSQTMLLLAVELNQAVLPDELAPALTLKIDGRAVSFEPEAHYPTSRILLKLTAADFQEKTKDLDLELKITQSKLAPGLKKWLKSDLKFDGKVISANQLVVYGVDVVYGESGTSLKVRMSQSVSDLSTVLPFSNNHPPQISVTGMSEVKALPSKEGMEITGNFPGQTALELELKKGLAGVCGGALMEDKTIGFQIGGEKAMLRFASSKALYLPKHGTRNVGVELEGVRQLQLSVYHVFPNNMLSTIASHGSFYNEDYDSEYENSYYSEYQDDYGTLVYSRSFRVNELEREGEQYLLPLDFNGLPGQKGIYIVTISDEDKRYIGAKKLVSITDIGLLSKTSGDEIWVQAQSIETGKPVDRLKVTVIGKNNQPLHTAETNANGELQINRNKLSALGTEPMMLVAENQDDFSYLHFGQTRVETSRFPVDGLPWSASGWQAEVFGPRNLYKPGEPIDLRILLRDKNLAAVSATPLLVKVMSPEGKMVHLLRAETGSFGEAGVHFIIPNYLKTGTYQAEVYGGAKELLASHALHIESFKPLPLVIQTGTISPSLRLGADWNLPIQVETMFGMPATQRPVEVSLSWEPAAFLPEGYSDFNFSLQQRHEDNLLVVKASTDMKGMAGIRLPLSSIERNQGLLDVKARIQVSDESNTPVYKSVTSQLLTQEGMLGYKLKGNRLYFRRSNKIELVCLNQKGKPVSGVAYLEVYASKWSTVMVKAPEEPSGYRYESKETRAMVAHQKLELTNGKGAWSFVPTNTGSYAVEIKSDPLSTAFLQFNSYVYESDNQAPPGEETDTEGNVEISCGQKELQPGQAAQVRFSTPFDGKLLVTVEQNRILKSYSLEVHGKSAVLQLPITADMAPNAYISATLTRSIGKTGHQNPLTVAYGYASVPVRLADKELKTKVEVPTKSASGVKLPITIELSSANESGLVLAVVDEGILGITQYKIPDPFQFFHTKKALAVETYGMYGKIFKSLTGGKSTTGGDAMYLKMAQNEVDKEEVSVLMWSKPGNEKETAESRSDARSTLKLMSNGQTKIYKAMVELPSGFAGKVRIMAVSYNATQVGFAEKVVTVADPITIKASAPDYLFPGDRFEGAATFFNTSKSALTIQPSFTGSSSVDPTAQWPSVLTIGPGEVSRLPFSLTGRAEGTATISIEAKRGKQPFRLTRKFEVKQPAWLVRHQVAGELIAGQSIQLNRPDFLRGKGLKADFEISANPFMSMAPAVNHLLRYPYGCLEQTISAAFPLVYLPDEWLQNLSDLPKTEAGQKWKKSVYLADAIQKVSGMQTYNGGFAYWPSSDDAVDYYSVYATHFLWEARQAGFSIDPAVLTQAQQFLERNLANRSEMNYRIGHDVKGNKVVVSLLDPAIPYALYTLALMGKPARSSLLQWKAQPEKLDQEGRYMIACALLLAGDPDGFQKMVPTHWAKTLDVETDARPGNDSDNLSDLNKSATQEEAFVLASLATTWPTHPMVKPLATRLRNKIALQSDLMSTQEEGMALVALSRLMKQNQGKEKNLTVTLGGKILLQNKTGKTVLGEWQMPLAIQNQNKITSLYYWVNALGSPADGKVPEADQGLEVRKSYYNALGQSINPNSLKLNDLIVVRLSLKSKVGKTIRQIALVDVVPSCLRIENGRIGQESGFTTATKPATPDYLDLRRDRINLFCSATKEESSYYYTARVVGMGTFFWGPAEAQSMYQSTLFSRHGSTTLSISENPPAGMAKR